MSVQTAGQVGPQVLSDGSIAPFRQGRTGEGIVQELHGRFYEQNYRGAIFSGGLAPTSINNSTYTLATLTASATPVLGVWNPTTSGVNLVILQASLAVVMTALQATGCSGFVWAVSTGNSAISTGAQPLNRKTLVSAGSVAKDMSNAALTGLTNSLVVKFGSSLNGGSAVNVAFLATQAGAQTQGQTGAIENFDGSLIIPPGGVLALLAGTTPVAHSATGTLLWEEVPV